MLMQVDESGHVTPLSDFSESEYGIYVITTHPDGYYLVSVIGGIVAVDSSGVQTPLSTWVPDEVGCFAFDLAVDYATGDVGVSGYYGAFGTLSAGGEWTTPRLTDMEAEAPDYIMYSIDHKDADGFYGGGFTADGFGIYRFDTDLKDWEKKANWDQDWSPHFLAVDSDSGDFYITTDGGQYPYAWKIDAATEHAATFYPDSGTIQPGISFWDLYTNY